nr:DUF2169 domain-containing protein [uncultured Pseudomonas sp.]
MRLTCIDISLLALGRQQGPDPLGLAITVGVLYDADGTVLPAERALPWLAERFGDEPFDRGLQKTRGTVAVHGSAFPLQASERSGGMAVRLRFGGVEKVLHVHPPRLWEHGLLGWSAKPCGPLQALPLDLRHTFGGAGWLDNPQGTGFIADPDSIAGTSVAQIEQAHVPLRTPQQTAGIASFMPLPPQCAERRTLWGTTDEHWQKHRAPYPPLDCQPRWFDEVAPDQCNSDYWTGTETWSVDGMHPTQSTVGGRLPGWRARLFVTRRHDPANAIEYPLELDTVWLFPDCGHVLMLSRACLAVEDPDGEDIAAIGAVCERDAHAPATAEHWLDKLWPARAAAAPIAPPAVPPVDTQSLIDAVQSALNARYADFAQRQQQMLKEAKQLAGTHAKDADFMPATPKAPDLAALLKTGSGAAKPFDAQALKSRIEANLQQAKAEVDRHLDTAAKSLGMSPAALRARIAESEQAIPAPDSLNKALDRLPLPPAEKAKLKAQVAEGMEEAKATRSQIQTKMDTLRADLAATQNITSPQASIDASPMPPLTWSRKALLAAKAAGDSLVEQRFVALDLSGADLSDMVLQRCQFEGCNLTDSLLTRAHLEGSRLQGCTLTKADLQQANLNGAMFQDCNLGGAQLDRSEGCAALVRQCVLAHATLHEAKWPHCHLVDSDLRHTGATGTDLSDGRIRGCDLTAADWRQSQQVRTHLDDCKVEGADFSGADVQRGKWSRLVGSRLNLRGIKGAGLSIEQSSQLPGACLDQADLTRAGIQDAGLQAGTLHGTRLDHALLGHCDLSDSAGEGLSARGADFNGSDLSRATWQGANLLQARLRKTCLNGTDLRGSNLHGVLSEGAHGRNPQLQDALMTRCRLREDLSHG